MHARKGRNCFKHTSQLLPKITISAPARAKVSCNAQHNAMAQAETKVTDISGQLESFHAAEQATVHPDGTMSSACQHQLIAGRLSCYNLH